MGNPFKVESLTYVGAIHLHRSSSGPRWHVFYIKHKNYGPSLLHGLLTMAIEEVYDVLIVGGGHAGLSAALTLYRQLHTSLIFDTQHPRNAWATPTHILTAWEGRHAEDLRAATRKELLETGLVSFRESEAREVKRTDIGFEIVDSGGQHWAGKKIIIAVGKEDVFPDIPGYVENYPERM